MKKSSCLILHPPLAIIIIIMLSLVRFNAKESILFAQNQPQYNGHENHSITLTQAAQFTSNFKNSVPSRTIVAEYFGKDAILAILNQQACIGLRIYYGKNDFGTPTLILVGVNSSGQDLTTGPLADWGFPCPPFCDTIKVLNH
jgi:hypothetical protein